jgi:hypothetical protein
MSTETIFICYSNKDSKFANDLANKLIKVGANVWIESLHGQDDDDVIEAAIKSAKLVLIVTSENALTDETLKQEKDFARANNVDRLLIKIDSCDTSSKMRWKSLPKIDFSGDNPEAMKALFDKLKLTGVKEVIKSDSLVKEPKSITENIEIPETVTPEIKVENIDTSTTIAETNDPDLARKESLLVSSDEIESVRSLFKKQIKESKIAIGLFIAASVVISVVVFVIFKFDIFSTEEISDVASTAENTYDKLTKFFPAVGAVLPNAFSGISASKIKDKKKRLAIVDKLERTRDRIKNNLSGTPESEIKALEEKLEELITL